MNKPLKHAVREHLESKSLTDEQLSRLSDMQTRALRKPRTANKPASMYYLLSALAGAAAAFVITLFAINPETTPLPELIAAEVAENHLNLKPADIVTSEMAEIKRYFTHLDFVPRASRLLQPDQWFLSGGRYCSIQGKSAAQLRLRQAGSDSIQTVYQSALDTRARDILPTLNEGESPLEVTSRGLRVKIWVEDDILFAMTDNLSDN